MFRGTHELNIDTKGRLAVPSKFREVLSRKFTAEDEQPRFVVSLENDQRLLIYPESEWEKVEQQLLALPVGGKPELRRYQELLLHNAETLEPDASGRVLIPAYLRQLVGLDKDVVLVGRVNRLELWSRERKLAETQTALAVNQAELDAQLALADLRL